MTSKQEAYTGWQRCRPFLLGKIFPAAIKKKKISPIYKIEILATLH